MQLRCFIINNRWYQYLCIIFIIIYCYIANLGITSKNLKLNKFTIFSMITFDKYFQKSIIRYYICATTNKKPKIQHFQWTWCSKIIVLLVILFSVYNLNKVSKSQTKNKKCFSKRVEKYIILINWNIISIVKLNDNKHNWNITLWEVTHEVLCKQF